MFVIRKLKIVFSAIAVLFSMSAAANELALEPCINGAVSPSGTHATAALEREANGYQTWSDYAPYYLFAVSAAYLESPFGDDVQGTDRKATSN